MVILYAALAGLLSLASTIPHKLAAITTSLSRTIVYVQTFHTESGGHLSLLPLSQQESGITHIYLAAIHVNEKPGDIRLNDKDVSDSVYDHLWDEAAQLQSNGIKVMMMLGGAARGSYGRLCSGAIINDDYYIPLHNALRDHNMDGVDVDIEEPLELSCPLALLRRLDQDFGPDFILTMAPTASDLIYGSGLGGFSYLSLDVEASSHARPEGKLVNWYNTQFYNGFGDASSPMGYLTIVDNGFSPDRVVMGVLSSGHDGKSGWQPIDSYKRTVSTLKTLQPSFGGVVGWEYWDAGSGDGKKEPWQWVQDVSSATLATNYMLVQNVTVEPLRFGQSPWPEATQTLADLGVPHLDAVRALNASQGSVESALRSLRLAKTLPLDDPTPPS